MDSTNTLDLETEVTRRKRGIPGSTLKLIAIFTMLIDHIGATIVEKTLVTRGLSNSSDPQALQEFMAANGGLYALDMVMRSIGRIGFPLFCFLLIEGFVHTHNKWNYAVRLGLFALISEIPFDLAFNDHILEFGYQNVFFTLGVGLLVMIGFEAVSEKAADKKWLPALALVGVLSVGISVTYFMNGIGQIINNVLITSGVSSGFELSKLLVVTVGIIICILVLLVYLFMIKKASMKKASIRFADLAILIAGMAFVQVIKTDYSAFGVLTIAVMYGLRRNHFKSMLGGCVVLTIMQLFEAPAFFALIPAALYNGERGLKLKYVFYAFYPVHLFILFLICHAMGLA